MTPKLLAMFLIGGVAAAYAVVCATKVWRADWPMAVVWFGYAFSNIGLLWLEYRT